MSYNSNGYNSNKNQAALPPTTLIWTAIIAILIGITTNTQMLVFTICLGISLTLYYFIKNSKNLLLKALKNVLLPLNIGLGLFWIMYLCITLFGFFSPSKIHNIEEVLINARLWSKGWLNISYAGFILMLVVLFVFNLFIPKWKIISKYLKLRQYMVYTVIILSTLCTFTFFSQFPSDKYIAKHHAQRIEEYKILLRDDFNSVGDYVAAKLIEKAINEIENNDVKTYKHTFGTIALLKGSSRTISKLLDQLISNQLTELSKNYHAKQLIGRSSPNPFEEYLSNPLEERLSSPFEEHLSKSLKKHPVNLWENNLPEAPNHIDPHEKISEFPDQEKLLIESIPETIEHKNKQKRIISEKTAIVKQNKIMAKEATKAVEALFINTIGLTVPEAEGIAGKYIKKLMQECSKKVFKSVVVEKFGLLKKLQGLNLTNFQIIKFNSYLKPKWNNPDNSAEELISNIKTKHEIIEYEAKKREIDIRNNINRSDPWTPPVMSNTGRTGRRRSGGK